MNLHKNRVWHAVENSNINYIHGVTLYVENDNNNDYKQLKSQEAKQARPTLHTHMHAHTHTRMHARTHAHTHTHTHTHITTYNLQSSVTYLIKA